MAAAAVDSSSTPVDVNDYSNPSLIFNKAKADLADSFDRARAPQVGNTLPSFSLPSATGSTVTLQDILSAPDARGAFITFYRGGWCPYCNRSLHGIQEHLPEFTEKGIKLVAISPEKPDNSLSTIEKNELKFQVLSDENAVYANEIGIRYEMPEYLERLSRSKWNLQLEKYNGKEYRNIVVPTNILVDKDAKIRNVFLETDYTKRIDPKEAVAWAKAL